MFTFLNYTQKNGMCDEKNTHPVNLVVEEKDGLVYSIGLKQYPTPRTVRIIFCAVPSFERMRRICASTIRPLPRWLYPHTALSKSLRQF